MKSDVTNNALGSEKLDAPFGYPGGKSPVTGIIWSALGDPAMYIEPFFGSGAALFHRPTPPQHEIVNDADGFIANFWRSLQRDPGAVVRLADFPVNETELLARHRWLCNPRRRKRFLDRLGLDTDYHDAKFAAWWVWCFSQWIGQGCANADWFGPGDSRNKGTGVNRSKCPRLMPSAIFATSRRDRLRSIFDGLSNRLRNVYVACGDWQRVLSPIRSQKRRTIGVFLDPPYAHSAGRNENLYRVEMADTSSVEKWCRENQRRPNLRIVLAGLEGEYDLPGWRCVGWRRHGAFARTEQGVANLLRERLWLSPHCLPVSIPRTRFTDRSRLWQARPTRRTQRKRGRP